MLQEGLEPPTLGLLDPCSTKLSYQSNTAPRSGSNQGPAHDQPDAQPTELYGHKQSKPLKLVANWEQKGIGGKIYTAGPKWSAVTQSKPMILVGAPRRVFFFLHIICKALWNCVIPTTWMLPVKASDLPLASSPCERSESSAQAILCVLRGWGHRCQISYLRDDKLVATKRS